MILAVLEVRQSEDGRGRGKVILQMLLADQGIHLLVSMVGRILAYLKEHGRLPEPLVPAGRKPRPVRPHATRRPQGTPPPRLPGDVVQIDTVRTRVTATTARDFPLEVVDAMPFRIRAIQIDGGSEFKGEIELVCRDLGGHSVSACTPITQAQWLCGAFQPNDAI